MKVKHITLELNEAEFETIKQALECLNNDILNELNLIEKDTYKASQLLKESVCYQILERISDL